MSYFVYIVECSDKTFYTGYTRDIKERLKQHNGHSLVPGAKYTSGRRPVYLHYLEKYTSKSEAMKREYAIKQFTKKQKAALTHSITDKELKKLFKSN